MTEVSSLADRPGSDSVDSPADMLVTSARARRARKSLVDAARIAVITKFRFMGDTVVATPFMAQLRAQVPTADIDLIAAPSVVDALANCPHVNRIIPVNMSGVSRWQHGKDLHEILKSGKYDVAFVLNRSLHCAVTTAISGVKVRVGYANELRRFLLTVPIPYGFDRHEVDCHLDMLRAVGLQARHALPDLWITEEEKQRAGEIVEAHGGSLTRPIVGLQPGANDPYIREWGAARYAALADRIADEMDAVFVLMGGASERSTADHVASAMKSPCVNLVGELALRDALAVIGLASLWVGNDTGLLHCAVAQRVPSVGIFGPNKVVRWGYDSNDHRSVVSFPVEPADTDDAVRACLDAITVEEVLASVRSAFSSRQAVVQDRHESHGYIAESGAQAPYFAAKIDTTAGAPIRRR